MSEFACPNGHPFPSVTVVPCDECDVSVTCVPIAAVGAAGRAIGDVMTQRDEAYAGLERLRAALAEASEALDAAGSQVAASDAHRAACSAGTDDEHEWTTAVIEIAGERDAAVAKVERLRAGLERIAAAPHHPADPPPWYVTEARDTLDAS